MTDADADTAMDSCDGCGEWFPLEQLSLTTFSEREGLVCAECKRHTTVVGLTQHYGQEGGK